MITCIERPLVARHFAGSIVPPEETQLRAHMLSCDACRRLYERHMLLARLDPQAIKPRERIARGLGLVDHHRPRWLSYAAVTTLAAAAAVALLIGSPTARSDGFAARGGALPPPVQSRVFLYDVAQGPRLLRSGDSIGRHDELALAYEDSAGKSRLMVFGVDEHRHVYWFYPAWLREADDPVAVSVAADGHRHELPDAVRHTFDGGTLAVHALFTDTPMSVHQAEAMVARQGSGLLAVPDAVETITTLTVSP